MSVEKSTAIVLLLLLLIIGIKLITDQENAERTMQQPTSTEACLQEAAATATAFSSQGESVTGTLAENTVEFTGPNSLIRTVTLAEFPNQSFYIEAKDQGNEVNSTLDITQPGTQITLVVKNDEIIYVLPRIRC